jgi:hypothetical protein
MPTTDDRTHRSLTAPRPDEVSLREADEVETADDMMEIRLPIASSGEVRNEGDEPLTGSEMHGMAQQVDSLTRGVFPEHGMSDAVDREMYSQFEKLGYWADADLQREASDDGEDLLIATARMPDPETLPAATGDYREALAILKEQAKRGIPISASIGWRDDGDYPGGVDLMEASIVGIGADPRTATEGGEAAVARAAIAAGADPDDLVAEVRAAVDAVREGDTDTERPFGPPGGDPTQWEDFDACVADVDDWDTIDDPEAFCAWAEQQQAASTDGQDEHMTDTDDPGDDTDTAGTDDAQDGGDADTTRAPEDLSEEGLLTFVAMHFDGMDESDLMQAVDAADGEYIGECDAEALYDLVSTVTGAEYDTVADAMADLMDEAGGDTDEDQGDYGEDEDEDGDDEAMNSQAADDDGDGDADAADDDQRDAADLRDEVDALRDELEETRAALASGDAEFNTADPDDVADELRGEGDDGADADASDDATADEQRGDDGDSLRDGWLTTTDQ